jgi:prevent-host-death family protein
MVTTIPTPNREDSMRRVAISELKARLSEYLTAVRAGEEVIVTDRGKPVARLAPISGPDETDTRLRMLVRTGQVRPPDVEGGIDPEMIAALRPRVPGADVLDALLDERREGR